MISADVGLALATDADVIRPTLWPAPILRQPVPAPYPSGPMPASVLGLLG